MVIANSPLAFTAVIKNIASVKRLFWESAEYEYCALSEFNRQSFMPTKDTLRSCCSNARANSSNKEPLSRTPRIKSARLVFSQRIHRYLLVTTHFRST